MKKRVVCAGTFDHLHQGHLDYMKQARALGDELIVIVARDETVMKIKGFHPTHGEEERRASVAGTGIPEQVLLGNMESDIFRIIEDLRPQIIALGYDQRVSEDELLRRFPDISIVRLASFQPEKFKSSFFRNNLNNTGR